MLLRSHHANASVGTGRRSGACAPSRSSWFAAGVAACGGAAWAFGGCSSSNDSGAAPDAGSVADATSDAVAAIDAVAAGGNDGGVDSSASDAGVDAGPAVTGMAIVSGYGTALAAAPGDALPLTVVFTLADGTTRALPAGMQVTWLAPQTITAQDPENPGVDDAGGPISILPDGGAQPTAFFVSNPYRTDRTDYPGLLFVINAGTGADAGVTVTAQVADAGTLSALVSIGALGAGNADAGAFLYGSFLLCKSCHGPAAEGSSPTILADGGVSYVLPSGDSPYPAPPLNAVTPDGGDPSLAADPAWNAALLGMAAQADIDNYGVALRSAMPDWAGIPNLQGKPLSAQDFADIYAWLQTQTP